VLTSPQTSVALRPVRPEDEAFLYEVYASTRADEMALVAWNEEQKDAFLHMQFNAQRTHYQKYYPRAEYQVIQRDENSIGRLIVDRSKNPILVIDIAILPEYRNNGIGTALITDLMAEAANLDWAIILHVEVFNPAIKLYERLGFVKTNEQGIYYEMMWRPQAN
jgi:ribosomal protein S18 acetylase RimI-like enzyme